MVFVVRASQLRQWEWRRSREIRNWLWSVNRKYCCTRTGWKMMFEGSNSRKDKHADRPPEVGCMWVVGINFFWDPDLDLLPELYLEGELVPLFSTALRGGAVHLCSLFLPVPQTGTRGELSSKSCNSQAWLSWTAEDVFPLFLSCLAFLL